MQEIGIPTGFEADLESITQLPTLKKVETENRKIVLYLDEVGIQNKTKHRFHRNVWSLVKTFKEYAS